MEESLEHHSIQSEPEVTANHIDNAVNRLGGLSDQQAKALQAFERGEIGAADALVIIDPLTAYELDLPNQIHQS